MNCELIRCLSKDSHPYSRAKIFKKYIFKIIINKSLTQLEKNYIHHKFS